MHQRRSSFLRVFQQRVGGLFHGNGTWNGGQGSCGGAYSNRGFADNFRVNQMDYNGNITQRDETLGSIFSNMIQWKVFACGEFRENLSGKRDGWRWLPARSEHTLSREWLVERMKIDRKRKEMKQKRVLARRIRPAVVGSAPVSTYYQGSEFQETIKPLTTEARRGSLMPNCPEEVKVAPVLARPILMITRNIEWANIAFGFEQQNRYVIMDPLLPQVPVGYIFEESNWLLRQILRTRRPLVAYVLDGAGGEAFRGRRPAWLINSKIYVEVDGKVIGEVHRRWHLWKRIYDLYLGKQQFAYVENPGFWFWTFSVRDENGNVLAEIDRNWRGFGYELFTDAGQYVVRFGELPAVYQSIEKVSGNKFQVPSWQDQTSVPQVDSLPVSRPLTLMERAVVLALAVSLDNDYFSRHVMGWGVPFPMVGETQ